MVLIRMASPSRMPSIKHLSDAQCQAVRHAASKHAASQTWHTPTRPQTRGKPPRPTSQGAAPPRLLRLPLLSQATAKPRIHSYPKLNGLLQTDSTRQQYPEHSRRCTSALARRYQICTHWSRHSNMTLQIVVSRPTKLHPAFLPSWFTF